MAFKIILCCIFFASSMAYDWKEYKPLVQQITQSVAEQMRDDFGLFGYGDTDNGDQIEWISLYLEGKRITTIEEARGLALIAIDKLLAEINAHQALQPFLVERPFPVKRIHLMINFMNSWNTDFHVVHMGTVDKPGIPTYLEYKGAAPYPFKITFYSELYEEAQKVNAAHPVLNLAEHQNTPLENLMDVSLQALQNQLKEKYNIFSRFMRVKMDEGLEGFTGHFEIKQRVMQDQARNLMLILTDEILKKLKTLTSDQLTISLAFRNRNFHPYHDGSLESVTLADNHLTYYQETPWEKPEEVKVISLEVPIYAEENYQEALKKQTPLEKGQSLNFSEMLDVVYEWWYWFQVSIYYYLFAPS